MLLKFHTSIACYFLLCCTNQIQGRHIHRKPAHVHQHRHRAESLTLATPTTTASAADSLDVGPIANDLVQVEEGLNSLSSDLMDMLAGLQQQIRSLEAVFSSQSYLTATSVDSSTSPATSATYTQTSTAAIMSDEGAMDNTAIPVTMEQTDSTLAGAPTSTAEASMIMSTTACTPTAHVVAFNDSTTMDTTRPSSNTVTQLYTSSYTFQPMARNNVAVYYGQSPNTRADGLAKLCASSQVDIVVLAFVNDFFHADGYPGVNFGPACDPPTTAQRAEAPGLLDCTRLGKQIQSCQKIGKPILVSLGGWGANTSFASDAQAEQFAVTLWHLFGAGQETPDLRPFGTDVVVDGFDIDNENRNTDHYETFAMALRAQFDNDNSKTYYLSAAPQCPQPDQSIPFGAMMQADFIWIQFYNNPSCNFDSPGFAPSFARWSHTLDVNSNGKTPRLYIGAGAFAGAGSGYVHGVSFKSYLDSTTARYAINMGGLMLWDGDSALDNVDKYGWSYLDYAKSAVKQY